MTVLGKDINSHYTAMIRRKAVSQWLETVSKPLVKSETSLVFGSEGSQFAHKEEYLDGILSLLSGRQILEACQKAQDYGMHESSKFHFRDLGIKFFVCLLLYSYFEFTLGDHHTALLLSQLSGSAAVRKLMCEQLDSWEKSKADAFINPQRLRLFLLVAGLPNYESSDESFINTCQLLDWKRAFATHLW